MLIRRLWPEAFATVVPFALAIPFLMLNTWWIGITISWYKGGVCKALAGRLGIWFIAPVSAFPTYVVCVIAGVAIGLVRIRRAVRTAWFFGIGMLITVGVPAVLTSPSELVFYCSALAHLVTPVLTVALVRHWRPVHAPGSCAKCGYDLTGNTSGVCPECGTSVTAFPFENRPPA